MGVPGLVHPRERWVVPSAPLSVWKALQGTEELGLHTPLGGPPDECSRNLFPLQLSLFSFTH